MDGYLQKIESKEATSVEKIYSVMLNTSAEIAESCN